MGRRLISELWFFLFCSLLWKGSAEERPRATLTSGDKTISVGGKVTLSCSVGNYDGWKFDFFRRTISTEEKLVETTASNNGDIEVSTGGIYRCRGGRETSYYHSDISDEVTIRITFTNKPVITTQPSWFHIFDGEKITLTCEVQGGGATDWWYEWRKSQSFLEGHEKSLELTASQSLTGGYSCWARPRDDIYSSTVWSEVFTLSVLPQPKAELSSSKYNMAEGSRVTLTCSVKQSHGWKYFWYKDQKYSLLNKSDTDVYSSQYEVSQEGFYWCRGGRGDPIYYTEYSDSISITELLSNKVTLTLQPDWPQFYEGETVTLRCDIDGGNTGRDYEWETSSLYNPPNLQEFRIESVSSEQQGDYRCKGKIMSEQQSTSWSNTVNLRLLNKRPRATLTSGDKTISVGGKVTLSCSVGNYDGWKFDFFRRTTSTREKLVENTASNNGDIEVSTGGIYRCRGGRGDPIYYTEYSDSISVTELLSNKVTLTLQPDWPQFYEGETVTLRCDIDGGNTGRDYEWETSNLYNPPNLQEFGIKSVSSRHHGDYRCKGKMSGKQQSTSWSNTVNLRLLNKRPRATLTSGDKTISVGGKVTLSCSVGNYDGWKFDFFRRTISTWEKLVKTIASNNGDIKVSKGGIYRCRGGRGDPIYYTEYSDSISITKILSNKATLTLQPDWQQFYERETVTLRCDIDGGNTGWDYEWETPSLYNPPNLQEFGIKSVSLRHQGDYRCKGKIMSEQQSTSWSNTVHLTVLNKPQLNLSVSPSWLIPGASVTLICHTEHPSAGWSFFWFQVVPESQSSYTYEPLPGTSSGTADNSFTVHGQTHTAGYACSAGRGDPVFYTKKSHAEFVWSSDVHPSASLTVTPARVQHFTSESFSLTCGGNSTQLRRITFETNKRWLKSFPRVTRNGSTYIKSERPSKAVYWCESGTAFSNAVNISTHRHGVILVSPVYPVPAGESVTLGCEPKTGKVPSDVIFYKNNKVVQNDTRGEMKISAVSESDQGFYKCRYNGEESAESWMAVKLVTSSPVFLTWIIGLFCGLLPFIFLLVLFCRYRRTKDSCFNRSGSTQQSRTTDHAENHLEHSSNTNNSPNQGDVTYSTIELIQVKNVKKTRPEEAAIYSDVKVKSSKDDDVVYAQVHKSKAKGGKGRRGPAAAEEMIYSNITHGQ